MMQLVLPYLALLFLGEIMLFLCFFLTCVFCRAVAAWWRARKKQKDR